MVNPLDCSSSWALTPVCTGRMGLGVGGAGVVGLTGCVVEWRVSLLLLSVSLDLLSGAKLCWCETYHIFTDTDS